MDFLKYTVKEAKEAQRQGTQLPVCELISPDPAVRCVHGRVWFKTKKDQFRPGFPA
jgi:hypothetical protein